MTTETATTKSCESIIRSLVQVRLCVSHWGGKTAASGIAKEIEKTNNAKRGAVETNIVYLPERYSKPVTTAVSRIRTYFNDNTLPWGNDSQRVVPSKAYQALMDQTTVLKHAFEEAAANITNNYADVMDAAKVRLGDLYDANKFPSEKQLKSKYCINIYRNSINAAEDVRIVGLSEATVADIRKDVSKQYEEQINTAVTDIIERMKEVMVDVVERTSKPSDGVKFATMISKMEKTYNSLTALNITADPKIEELLTQFKSVSEVNAETLRQSESTRRDVTGKAKSMLDALNSFAG